MPDDDDRVGAVFSALADPTRRYVVQALAGEATVTASQLAERLPISRQAVAKHLGALGEAGLVTAQREGREVRYRLTPDAMADAMGWMAAVGASWDSRLSSLQEHLRRRG